jgi:Thioredoxin-like [2Fe-2S] ferredoxin/Glyceraldehyde 3-phosphate dehydrogenase, C-terminal domain
MIESQSRNAGTHNAAAKPAPDVSAAVSAIFSSVQADRGRLLDIVQVVQHRLGYLSHDAIHAIAIGLGMHAVEVEDMASFYTFLNRTPKGRYHIRLSKTPVAMMTRNEINAAFTKAAGSGPLLGILAVTRDPLVSVDLNHTPFSCTVDLTQTQVVEGKLARVLAWYDNEWGFSTRMIDVALAMARV